jgi:GntR family transcriptional regulator
MDDFAPRYVQIYNEIRNSIILQQYTAGSFLPTEKQLMEKYAAGRSTIRHALSLLKDEGYINIQQGSGSMIYPLPEQQARKFNKDKWSVTSWDIEYRVNAYNNIIVTPSIHDIVPAPFNVSQGLGLPPGTQVSRLQGVWFIDDSPYSYMQQYINMDIVPGIDQYLNEIRVIYDTIEKRYGLHLLGAEEHVGAKIAGFIESNILHIDIGAPLLYTYRIATCEKGRFENAEFYTNPEMQGYVLQFSSTDIHSVSELKA